MYMIKEHLSWQKINAINYIVDERTGRLYELNEIASCIWDDIVEKNCFNDIIEKIAKKYQVDKNIVAEDATELINDFIKKEFIEVAKEMR